MKNSAVALVSFLLLLFVTPAVYAGGKEHYPPPPPATPSTSDADAVAKAAAEADAQSRSVSDSKSGASANSGASTSSANGGNGTGGSVATGPVSTGPATATSGPTTVSTTNSSRILYAQLPGAPPVAPPTTGYGGGTVSGHCGPLRQVIDVPVEYVLKNRRRKPPMTTFLQGQFTQQVVPVKDTDGHVIEFLERENADGSFSQIGSIYDTTGVVISMSIGRQFTIGGIGGSAGGNASMGSAGAFTGLERMVALGLCEYSKYRRQPVVDPNVPDLRKENLELRKRLDKVIRGDK